MCSLKTLGVVLVLIGCMVVVSSGFENYDIDRRKYSLWSGFLISIFGLAFVLIEVFV